MSIALPFSVWLNSPWRRGTLTVKRAIVIGAVFGLLIYLGAQPGRDLLFRATGVVNLSGSGTQPAKPAEARREIDPVSRFTQTRVGHLLFSIPDSEMCRRVLFDNRTGAMREAGVVVCGQPVETPPAEKQERGNAMMRAFRR
jgi:hypothetical protein